MPLLDLKAALCTVLISIFDLIDASRQYKMAVCKQVDRLLTSATLMLDLSSAKSRESRGL